MAEALASIRAHREPDSTERRDLALVSFDSKLDALRYVDELTADEREDWHNRLLVALGIEPPPPAEPGTIRAIYIGPGSPPVPAPAPDPPRFLRQWPGPDEELELYGGRLRVISLELYDTMFLVRWRAAPEPDLSLVFESEAAQHAWDVQGVDEWAKKELQRKAEHQLQMRRLYHFELTDDVGTDYLHRRGGSHGGPSGTTGEAEFVPAPPSKATRLEFTWLDVTVELPLR